MPLLTRAQFKARRPQGDYQAYLRYVARKGGAAMSAAASAALAGGGGSGGGKPSAAGGSGGSSGPGSSAGGSSGGGAPSAASGQPAGLYSQWASAYRSGDEGAQLRAINQLLGSSYGSVDEATRALDLGYGFAGLEQWRQNLGGSPVSEAGNPALLNVSMGSAATDTPSFQRLWNYLFDVGPEEARRIVAERAALVPEWAPAAYDAVTGQGVNWSTELFGSPEVNYRDPSRPLFGAGQTPTSLSQLGSLQAGEGGYLQGLSAAQVMTELYPLLWRSRNDPGFRQWMADEGKGLSFGAGVGNSLMMDAPSYQTYAALGHPGDPTMKGVVHGSTGGADWSYSPLLGQGDVSAGGRWGQQAAVNVEGILSGAIRPEYFADPASYWEMVRTSLGSGGAAAFTGDPSYWFRGAYEGANPVGLDPDYVKRLLALITGEASPGVGEVE